MIAAEKAAAPRIIKSAQKGERVLHNKFFVPQRLQLYGFRSVLLAVAIGLLLCNWTYVHCLYCTQRSSSTPFAVAVVVVVVDGLCLYAHNEWCTIYVWLLFDFGLAGWRARSVCATTNCYGVHFVSICMRPCVSLASISPSCVFRLDSYRLASGWSKVKELSVKCIASQCDKPLCWNRHTLIWSNERIFMCLMFRRTHRSEAFAYQHNLTELDRINSRHTLTRTRSGSQHNIKLNQSVSQSKWNQIKYDDQMIQIFK